VLGNHREEVGEQLSLALGQALTEVGLSRRLGGRLLDQPDADVGVGEATSVGDGAPVAGAVLRLDGLYAACRCLVGDV
jgi:hypothetical protein